MTIPSCYEQSQGWREREREKAKADFSKTKGKFETAEDSLNQALVEIDSTKKAAYEEGYQKGFDATTASYVEQMPAIQDWIWVACWEACQTKVGVAKDSPLWIENDLPSNRHESSHDSDKHSQGNVEQQIDEFADADESIPTESDVANAGTSLAREETNVLDNLEENTAGDGPGVEVNAEDTNVTLPEIQNLD